MRPGFADGKGAPPSGNSMSHCGASDDRWGCKQKEREKHRVDQSEHMREESDGCLAED